jgi:hypothetical protein
MIYSIVYLPFQSIPWVAWLPLMSKIIDLFEYDTNELREFKNCINDSFTTTNQSEILSRLEAYKSLKSFSSICLYIINDTYSTSNEKLFTALFFKNYVKELINSSSDVIYSHALKNELIELYYSSLDKVADTIIDIIELIALQDFPKNWEELFEKPILNIDRLISDSILQKSLTLLSVSLKKFVISEPSDDLYIEILFSIEKIGNPLLKFIDYQLKNNQFTTDTYQIHDKICSCLRSLFFHDIPEYFSSNLNIIFNYIEELLKLLVTTNPSHYEQHISLLVGVVDFIKLLIEKFQDDIPNIYNFFEYLYFLMKSIPNSEEYESIGGDLLLLISYLINRSDVKLEAISEKFSLVNDLVFNNMMPSKDHIEYILDEPLLSIKNLIGGSLNHRFESSIYLFNSLLEKIGQPLMNSVYIMLQNLKPISLESKVASCRLIGTILSTNTNSSSKCVEFRETEISEILNYFIVPFLATSLNHPFLAIENLQLYVLIINKVY